MRDYESGRFPDELIADVTPVAEMDDLIYERTGAKPGTSGGFFSLNPRVDDIPDRFSISHRGVRFLRLGSIEAGGSGCICPESAMLKALVTHLMLYRDELRDYFGIILKRERDLLLGRPEGSQAVEPGAGSEDDAAGAKPILMRPTCDECDGLDTPMCVLACPTGCLQAE